jgi:hypothetical protein
MFLSNIVIDEIKNAIEQNNDMFVITYNMDTLHDNGTSSINRD